MPDSKPSSQNPDSRVDRPFPRRTLEQALRVPRALRDHNGGNAWSPVEVSKALSVGSKTSNFWYISAAARDFGLTTGTRDSAEIALTDLGRSALYPRSADEEKEALKEAFLGVELFKEVIDYFNGNNLPEKRFLTNTLHQTFGLHPDVHDEFVELFDKNCRFVGIGSDWPAHQDKKVTSISDKRVDDSITVSVVAENAPVCFVIMPFTERDDRHPAGFFEEAFLNLLTPAITEAGFSVRTAKRQGSDVIQSTIVNELLEADLVVADLTEHNPNVLFELGLRMAENRPVALIRAKGTGPIFDVDNMLRVEDYDPNLWKSSLSRDLPKIRDHVRATWEARDNSASLIAILRQQTAVA